MKIWKNEKFTHSQFRIPNLTNKKISGFDSVTITRYYDGHYLIDYPNSLELSKPENKDDEDEEKECMDIDEAVKSIMPKFVYYSNYGNLSSKIYLPHALKWIKGEKVQGIDTNDEQVRTLKVLFDFVNLDPQEIMELGEDPKVIAMQKNRNAVEPSADEIKKQRNIRKKEAFYYSQLGHF